jgi:ferritin
MEKLLSEVEIKALNKFGQFEMTASHTYMFLANRMRSLGYFGAAKFFNAESDDERVHYRKLEDFANDMSCELSVESLENIDAKIENISDALNHAYVMERELMDAYESVAGGNSITFKTRALLHDFVNIQIKAVGEYSDLLTRLALSGDVLVFDQELGE